MRFTVVSPAQRPKSSALVQVSSHGRRGAACSLACCVRRVRVCVCCASATQCDVQLNGAPFAPPPSAHRWYRRTDDMHAAHASAASGAERVPRRRAHSASQQHVSCASVCALLDGRQSAAALLHRSSALFDGEQRALWRYVCALKAAQRAQIEMSCGEFFI